uniref:Uncharacterized protein n=1 Tax=Candidatus Methanogaster sp. ANME-2c ERB4 TaxID=2759911 RepID=A0A7G9YN54_9EURY|nr:hypothetical protein JHKIABMC_00044 [Methanosarcinales archaeon ANME-2c ERB4]
MKTLNEIEYYYGFERKLRSNSIVCTDQRSTCVEVRILVVAKWLIILRAIITYETMRCLFWLVYSFAIS